LEAIVSGGDQKIPEIAFIQEHDAPNDQQVPFIANHIECTTHRQDERLT
jgi:hypothetical protein